MRGRGRAWVDGRSAAAGRVVGIVRDAQDQQIWRLSVEQEGGRVTVGVQLPEGCGLPVELGQEIAVRTRSSSSGIHPLFDSLVARADGTLLVAQVASGDPAFCPPFEVMVAQPARPLREAMASGMARESSHVLRFRCGTAEGWVADGNWAAMWVDGAEYAISGRAVRWEPGKNVPPDAKDYEAWSIVRKVPDESPTAPA